MTSRPTDTPPPSDASDDADDITEGFAPNCPHCLRQLEPHTVGDRAVWRCPGCGLLVLS